MKNFLNNYETIGIVMNMYRKKDMDFLNTSVEFTYEDLDRYYGYETPISIPRVYIPLRMVDRLEEMDDELYSIGA